MYLDDILMYIYTINEHLQLLQEVFALLQKYTIDVKEPKCHLFMEMVEFLGFFINAKEVHIDQGKVDVVIK